AILVSTVEPKGDYSGYAQAGYGSYNHEQFKGAVDLPILKDELAIRFSMGINNMDGYVDQVDFACANPAGAAAVNAQIANYNAGKGPFLAPGLPAVAVFGPALPLTTSATPGTGCKVGELGGGFTGNFHGALAWTPTSDLRVDLKADLLDIRNEQPATTTIYINPNYPGSLVGLAVPGYSSIFLPPNRYTTYEGTFDAKTGTTYPNENNTTSWGFAGTVNYDTAWGIHLKDILAYRYYTGDFGVWAGGSPIPVDNVYNEVTHHQFSEEFQLSGKLLDNSLEWVAGAYYYTAYSKYYGQVDLPPLNFFFNQDDPILDHNTSGFVHTVYHITDDFTAEAGIRYSTQDKEYSYYRFDPLTGGCVFGFPAATGCHLGPITTASQRFDPKIEFDYHLNPDAMAYFNVATGFKAGGVNPRPANILAVTTFKPEDLTAYEIGEKSEWFDHKLRVNFDGFVENYKELQTPFIPLNPAFAGGTIYENIGHVMPYGVEFDYAAQPIPGLQIDGSGGWLHWNVLHLGADVVNQANAPLPGEKPGGIGIPSWKLSAGIQYNWDLPDEAGTLVPRLDWNYTGTEYFGNQHAYVQLTLNGPHIPVPILGRQPGYSVFNASLRWDSPDSNWEAMFQVFNLTDEFYYEAEFASLLSLYGNIDATPSLPRTYFFSVKRIFGPAAPAPAPYVQPPAPPPAPPPSPQVEAKRSFQVFFDFDKSNITAAAARVIQEAADAVKAGNVVQITVTGHTDTVGTASYNQGLSERRAASVKGEMVRDGVAAGEITTVGVGKTGLLVPTADGVREPQNRRAEIVLQ
ncbi:MAG TPA: TonB-dependent receptor, partial [Stellaceae bacterium]|nr:TonB-dependent receptor [Stellaceae bacterium]